MLQPDSMSTVSQRLSRRAAATPLALAFQYPTSAGAWKALDWAAFNQQVIRLRRGMSAAGLRKGDRLALIAPVSLAWELVHHAAMGMGVAVVGLDAHDLPERLARMAELAGVTAYAVADVNVLQGLAAARGAVATLVIDLEPMDAATSGSGGRQSLAALMALGDTAAEPPAPDGGDVATVIFTSGTTGAPKGIAYTHAQLGLAIDATSQAFAFVGVGGRLLCWLPLSNLFQRVVNLAAVQNGATTYLLADPRQVMDHVAAVSPDVFIGVPRFYEKLHEGLLQRIASLRLPQRWLAHWAWQTGRQRFRHRESATPVSAWLAVRHRLAERLVLQRIRAVMGHRLQCMVSGSAAMPMAMLEDFEALGWTFLEAYGLSENVLPMAMNRLGDRRLGTVGRALPGNHIQIGTDGLVRVRGPGVFSGYLGDVSGTERDEDGCYVTGDLGTLDADGFLRLTGRQGDLIKTSTGRRIAPLAIESVLQTAPGVDQVVILGAGRKYLLAVCTSTPGSLQAQAWPGLQAAIQTAASRLAPAERPAGVLVRDQPFSIADGELTPNLKLRRAAIEERLALQIDALCRQIDQHAHLPGAAILVVPLATPPAPPCGN